MKEYKIMSDNRNETLKFEGKLIGSGSNKGLKDTRWTTWSLYKSLSGRYIYVHANLTMWEGEKDYVESHIFDSIDKFEEFFIQQCEEINERTLSRYQKEFLEEVGIELIEEV